MQIYWLQNDLAAQAEGVPSYFIKRMEIGHFSFKGGDCLFEASEDIITKFESQALHIKEFI